MGQCNCSEQLNHVSDVPPISLTSKVQTIREQFSECKEIENNDSEKLSSKTKQMEESVNLDKHKPDPKYAWLSNKSFQSENPIVREVLAALGTFECEEEDGYHFGVYELNDGTLYQGTWKDKERFGTQIWKNGSIFEGQFSNNQANGKGRMIYADGDFYIGQWVDDMCQGIGTYTHNDGTVYVGDWFRDMQHGRGSETFKDGSSYQGDYERGKKQGQGIIKFKDG
ncbi:hypothetical protein pb186bvf_017325, partial [Paramecium bursaria]